MNGEIVSIARARAAAGLRLVITQNVPNPWGEAAKGMLYIKGIEHVRAWQVPGGPNEELLAWTGINSSPIAIYNDEPPRPGWVEILHLAERLNPDPPLIPDDERDRALMFGMAHELCSEDGYAWNKRMIFFRRMETATDDPLGRDATARMRRKYAYGGDADHAKQRMIAIWRLLSDHLKARAAEGHRYYFSNRLSAMDLYSATFIAMVQPLPIELCPTSPELHATYTESDPDIRAAADPILFSHRDYIYQTYLELPMRL